MNNKNIVVAIGRSAFSEVFEEQKKNVKRAAAAIADLAGAGYGLVITHSNGQQMGMIHSAMSEYSRIEPIHSVAPMSLCGAMSQGYIGYDLQNAIRTALLENGLFRTVSTIITQVKVDPFDRAFHKPGKPIGRYLTEDEATAEEKKGNYIHRDAKGRRRIVASPKPMVIYEIDAISTLLQAGQIVIAGGGGGIPVFEQGTVLRGASAIIEKDYTAARLAQELDVDILLFLTGAEKLHANYKKEGEEVLDTITSDKALEYLEQGKFEIGHTYPKVDAAVSFVRAGTGKKAVITCLETALDGISGKTGTTIVK
jgi:carbamate kinase